MRGSMDWNWGRRRGVARSTRRLRQRLARRPKKISARLGQPAGRPAVAVLALLMSDSWKIRTASVELIAQRTPVRTLEGPGEERRLLRGGHQTARAGSTHLPCSMRSGGLLTA